MYAQKPWEPMCTRKRRMSGGGAHKQGLRPKKESLSPPQWWQIKKPATKKQFLPPPPSLITWLIPNRCKYEGITIQHKFCLFLFSRINTGQKASIWSWLVRSRRCQKCQNGHWLMNKRRGFGSLPPPPHLPCWIQALFSVWWGASVGCHSLSPPLSCVGFFLLLWTQNHALAGYVFVHSGHHPKRGLLRAHSSKKKRENWVLYSRFISFC